MTSLSPELQTKHNRLLDMLAGFGHVVVAFSAGVDSTVVAKAARLACGSRALAVTADSPSVPAGEVTQARELAALIDIRHEIIYTQEFATEDYLRNGTDRCYFCKSELYAQLDLLVSRYPDAVVCNGANLDDLGDYRPGMSAAKEHAVRSPLIDAGLTKPEVRHLAQFWQLPVWDKPASPCLSSRIAYGVPVTPAAVRRIDAAEQFLKQQLGLRELRVRLEANNLARIEIPVGSIPALLDEGTRRLILQTFQELGFRYITLDLEGLRSGSMNAAFVELSPPSSTTS